ncbi:MAG TPA: phage holin family protein [Labilithrix sp.]|jgi:uncharacterized membrane protein YqjE
MNDSPLSERSPDALEAMPTSELVKGVVAETRALVKLEIELAKEEVTLELKKAERAAIAAAIGLLTTILLLAMLSVAIVLAFGGTAIAALIVAACFFVLSGVAGIYAYGAAPKKPLERTRRRLEADMNQLKEHIA